MVEPTSTTSTGDTALMHDSKLVRGKKRKVALFFAYVGAGYSVSGLLDTVIMGTRGQRIYICNERQSWARSSPKGREGGFAREHLFSSSRSFSIFLSSSCVLLFSLA